MAPAVGGPSLTMLDFEAVTRQREYNEMLTLHTVLVGLMG